jgi:hypothetical protein
MSQAAETFAPDSLVAKAHAFVGQARERTETARGRAAAAERRAHDAEVREALTRTDLTVALLSALTGRADAAAHARRETAKALASVPASPIRRRHNRLSRKLDQLLARFGSFGQALVLARAGVWRGAGGALFNLRHMAAYARRGARADVQPYGLFHQAWYLETYEDVRQGRAAPLVHYLLAGAWEGRAPHPLFDPAFYARVSGPEMGAAGVSALEHYERRGARLGRDPHPLFDVVHYAGQLAEPLRGQDHLTHYMERGWAQGLSPHPLFDPHWYVRQMPREERTVAPLVHYLSVGWRRGLSPHPLFDPTWYLEASPDVAASGQEPLTHFLLAGGAEGRSPGPWFDTAHYVQARGEGLAPGVNPLVDYLRGGAWMVSEPRPGFANTAYLAANPDLARSGLTPLEHWARRSAR